MSHWITASNLTPLLLSLTFVAVTAVRSLWLRRTAGVSVYVIDHGDPMHRFIGAVFVAVVVGLVAYFGAIALWPPLEAAMGRLDWAANDATRWISVAVMALAIVWTGYAQFSMGDSWRIGIPQGDAPPLRTQGPFAISRNPIFLGMLLFVLGMTLWSASAVTLALLAATYIALEVQIRGEEAYLEKMHGAAYRNYCAHVRRWL
jgi:protein-S-isoprenylcysteine O-methyltransferase Ste14